MRGFLVFLASGLLTVMVQWGALQAQEKPSANDLGIEFLPAFSPDQLDNTAKPPEALDLAALQKAAAQGDAEAQYNLGLRYATGSGVARDEAMAVQWYQKAAEQGHARAQYNLGWIYERGRGVARDEAAAAGWYQKAAEQGRTEAQKALARLAAAGDQGREGENEPAQTFTNDLGLEFTLIPAGSFMMGMESVEDMENWQAPQHQVTISRPFYLGVYEVTQEQWEAVMGSNPSDFPRQGHPVDSVNWDDVQVFIEKLNAQESRGKYRLPTEAEWEYAARAGTDTAYFFGDDAGELGQYAWYYDHSGTKSQPVGQKQPNPWGLYDIYGNVIEWVGDSYEDKYYASSPATDPSGPSSDYSRVIRGGAWNSPARDCRSAVRRSHVPYRRHDYLGFRLAFSPGQ